MLSLFLRGQQLFQLKPGFPEADRRRHVCGLDFDDKVWDAVDRDKLCAESLAANPPLRVAVVCDAGLGKTTHMEWLKECRPSRVAA